MLRISSPSDPNQDIRPGDAVRFDFDGAAVAGTVRRIDVRAHPDAPHGLPYVVSVVQADPASGYQAGRDYTVRAACLVLEGDAVLRPPRPPRSAPRSVQTAAPAAPRFLVGFMREGGQFPQQGAILVQAPTLDEANAIATRTLASELEADIAEGREEAGASVMLVNAAEVGPVTESGVLGQVSW
ncbi:hypothetical protein [Gemmatimonas phototrophica]|uniref:Uncharacterized protein n=1 Tax=Gemmatimonas phototrophica TaxID=1379270 RepID=A0A143BJE1_9BACT|nr:hypothetical protein [Gemmatimonas phototrophica]AMW05138.1 hypothetical protein GEMMAAP_10535 [Gemmatimonas phototrophica]